jgi:hypothetical protein
MPKRHYSEELCSCVSALWSANFSLISSQASVCSCTIFFNLSPAGSSLVSTAPISSRAFDCRETAGHSFGDLCGSCSSFFSVISPNSSRASRLSDLLKKAAAILGTCLGLARKNHAADNSLLDSMRPFLSRTPVGRPLRSVLSGGAFQQLNSWHPVKRNNLRCGRIRTDEL